ncbi:unnamed protein product [Polarella glacialis]|uniref:Uncharacterized protein n=1 Tax=Polarella glacialis TaxID=89957 RepID=A0A813KVV0_POLGL|nr:unnamed protein product [Polarella glacialis]
MGCSNSLALQPRRAGNMSGSVPNGLYQGLISHNDLGDVVVPAKLKIELKDGTLYGDWEVFDHAGLTNSQWSSIFSEHLSAAASESCPFSLLDEQMLCWAWTSSPQQQLVSSDSPGSASDDQANGKIRLRCMTQVGCQDVIRGEILERGVKKRPQPVAQWDFRRGHFADLKANNSPKFQRYGHAYQADDGLVLSGDGFVVTEPLNLAQDLKAKTLEVWVAFHDSAQRDVGVMGVGLMDGRGALFDAVAYNQRGPRQWLNCSEFFNRTHTVGGAEESWANRSSSEFLRLVITYEENGRIQIYRNGMKYGQSYKTHGPVLLRKDSRVVFGVRHVWPFIAEDGSQSYEGTGHFEGVVQKAMLYDRALSEEEIHSGSFEMWSVHGAPYSDPEGDLNLKDLLKEFDGVKPARIAETKLKALTVPQLQRMVRYAARSCHNWPQRDGLTRNDMWSLNLYDLAKWLILPLTKPHKCSMVELFVRGDQPAVYFVSHWWGERIIEMLYCLVSHSESRNLKRDSGYWVCAYANNQWTLDNELSSNPETSSFYLAMTDERCRGVLVVLDPEATAFTRIWCAFEEFVALDITDALCRCGSTRPWSLDVVTFFKGEGTLLTQDTTVKDCTDHKPQLAKSTREARFPMQVLGHGLMLDLATAQATSKDDEIRVNEWMERKGGTKVANHRLRAVFAILAWRQCLTSNAEGSSDVEKLKLGSILRSDESLKVLRLDLSFLWLLQDRDVEALADGIPMSSLESVWLGFEWCTQLTNQAVVALGHKLRGASQLRDLHVSFFECTGIMGQAAAEFFYEICFSKKHLEVLMICFPQTMGDGDILKIVEALTQQPGLQDALLKELKLSFRGCEGMTDRAIEHFITWQPPQTMSSLKLCFAGCRLSAASLDSLSEWLARSLTSKTRSHLTVCLNFQQCLRIEEQAFHHLKDSLSKIPSLNFTLETPYFSDDGGGTVASTSSKHRIKQLSDKGLNLSALPRV